MDRKELLNLITEEKKKYSTVILAHTYQAPEIIDAADITGDSFALAKKCLDIKEKRVIMCGVRFMAESVKILSPEKEVILPVPSASCPMAEMISPERVRLYKASHPGCVVVAYINTTARLKAECDVCVTSSSALSIVSKIDAPEILFIPDKNLGSFVKDSFPDKNITVWDGYCPVHDSLEAKDVIAAKALHPDAVFAVHPECTKDVLALADMIGSTAEIIRYSLASDKPVIIGTERGVADYLTEKHPEKTFYYMAPEKLVCRDMKCTTPEALLGAIRNECGEKIELDEELRLSAKRSIDKMLEMNS